MAVLVLGIAVLVYLSGGPPQVSIHLMYIPILVAALRLGPAGAVLTALAAGLAVGPAMHLLQPIQLQQGFIEWVLRLAVFVVVGLVASILFNHARKSKQYYYDLADAISEGFLSLDQTGRIVYVNQKMTRLLGCERSELLGKLPEEFMDEENKKIHQEAWERQKSDQGAPHEVVWTTRSGSKLSTRVSPQSVLEGTDFQGAFCVVTDLTESTAAQAERERHLSVFKRMLGISPNIIFNLGITPNTNGEAGLPITYVSENLTKIMGYSPEECLADPQWWDKHVHPEDLAPARARRPEVFENGHLVREYRYRHKNGEYRTINEELTLLRDEQGLPMDIFGTWSDVTDVRAAEAEKQAMETEYRHLFENMTQGVVTMNPEGIMVDVNPAGVEILGLTREQLLGQSYSDPRWRIIHEDGSAIAFEEHPFTLALKTGRLVSGFLAGVFHLAEQQFRWVKVEAVPRFTPGNGNLLGINAIFTDITADRLREKELLRLNRALTSMYGMNQVILRAQDEPTLLEEVCRFIVSSGDYRLAWIGYTDGEGTIKVQPMARAGAAEQYLEELQRIWQECGQAGATEQARKTGQARMIRDITAEEDGQPWKEAALKYGLRSLLALPLIAQERVLGTLTIYSDQPEAFHPEEVQLLIGLTADLAIAISGLRTQADLARREKQLRQSEARYRAVVNHASDVILILQDNVTKYANRRVQELLGYTEEELNARRWTDNIHPDDREMVVDRYQARLAGTPVPSEYTFRVQTKDGRTLWVETRASQILWDDRPASMSFIRDITRNKELEEELRQAQKMEAVGVLAGGVAHDFNNLLQMIGGYAELVLLDLEEGDPGHEELTEVVKAVGRAGELTDRLLTFGRKVESTLQTISLNDSVKRVAKLLDRTLPKMIETQVETDDDLWMVEGDPAQMDQVLMNLGLNARDAMPEGGRLTIFSKNVTVTSKTPDLPSDMPPGDYALVSMSDTGTGMDQATRERIFDPFFTTKEVGKGTGLGLSMIYGIVKSHQGFISCLSEPGQGATFNLYLPRRVSQSETMAQADLEETEEHLGQGTILLVDDESVIREFVGKILRRQGYLVLLADSGEQAIEIFEENMEDIDLVLLDMMMPGMGGKKCLEKILELKADVKVIVASGYGFDGSLDSLPDIAGLQYLRKPFRMQELISSVRQGLQETSQASPARKDKTKDA